MFFSLFFPPVLQLSLLGLEPSQNPWCLASGPNEAQALIYHCKNSVRGGFVEIQREAHSTGCGPSTAPWNVVWLVFASWVISYANG